MASQGHCNTHRLRLKPLHFWERSDLRPPLPFWHPGTRGGLQSNGGGSQSEEMRDELNDIACKLNNIYLYCHLVSIMNTKNTNKSAHMEYSSNKACNHKWSTSAIPIYRYITLLTSKTWTLKTSPPARPLFVDQLPLEIHVTPSQCNWKLPLPNKESLHDWTMMLRSPWIKSWSKVPIIFGSFLLQVKHPASHETPWIIQRSMHFTIQHQG